MVVRLCKGGDWIESLNLLHSSVGLFLMKLKNSPNHTVKIVRNIAFPEEKRKPTRLFKLKKLLFIPFLILLELLPPEIGVGPR